MEGKQQDFALFASSLTAIRRMRSRFKALDARGENVRAVLVHLWEPALEHSTYKDGTLLAKHSRYVEYTFNSKTKVRGVKEAEYEVMFRGGWEIFKNHAQLPRCERFFFIFGEHRTTRDLLNITTDCACLLVNVMHQFGRRESMRLLFPDAPEGVLVLRSSGLWISLVCEIGRWELPSTSFYCSGESHADQIGATDIVEFDAPDITVPDLWTNDTISPILKLSVDRFVTASIAVCDLLIEWGESGACPWQQRIDMNRSVVTGTTDIADAPSENKKALAISGATSSVEKTAKSEQQEFDESMKGGIVPVLSQTGYLILVSLLELGAVSPDTRKTIAEVAVRCNGPDADENVFKPLLSELNKKHNLTDSKTGRGGGVWLKNRGIEVTHLILARGKSNQPKQ